MNIRSCHLTTSWGSADCGSASPSQLLRSIWPASLSTAPSTEDTQHTVSAQTHNYTSLQAEQCTNITPSIPHENLNSPDPDFYLYQITRLILFLWSLNDPLDVGDQIKSLIAQKYLLVFSIDFDDQPQYCNLEMCRWPRRLTQAL